jgi:hypothetical protein
MYVAISKQLIESTKDNIKKLQVADVRSVRAVLATDYTSRVKTDKNNPELISLIWGNHLHLRDQMPSNWKFEADVIEFKINIPECGNFEYSVDFNGTFECPYTSSAREGYNCSYYAVKVEDINNPLFSEFVDLMKKIRACEDKWAKIKKQVIEFLENCKSLNEGLKLWPDLRLYIDQQFIEKVESEGNKKKRADENKALEALKSLDTDLAVSAYVGARFSGAGQ